MRERPYKNYYFNQLEQKAINSNLTNHLMSDLLYELTHRKATSDVKRLQNELLNTLASSSESLVRATQVMVNPKPKTIKTSVKKPIADNHKDVVDTTLQPIVSNVNTIEHTNPNVVFSLVDLPVSLRRFASDISTLHNYKVKSLLGISEDMVSVEQRGLLSRLKKNLEKVPRGGLVESVKCDSALPKTTKESSLKAPKLYVAPELDKPKTKIQNKSIAHKGKKLPKIPKKSVCPSKESAKKSLTQYLDVLNELVIGKSTLLQDVPFPAQLISARNQITTRYPEATVADLMSMKSAQIKQVELNSLKTFCRKRLKGKSLSKSKVPAINLNADSKIGTPKLKESSKPNSSSLRVESTKFNLSDVPSNLTNLIRKTAEIHKYRSERLVLHNFPDLSDLELRAILRLKKSLVKSALNAAPSNGNDSSEPQEKTIDIENIEGENDRADGSGERSIASIIDSIFCDESSLDISTPSLFEEEEELSSIEISNIKSGDITETPSKPIFLRETLLDEVELPIDLISIKDIAGLSLGLRPTVGEFLATSASKFLHLNIEQLEPLRTFFLSRLKGDQNESDIMQGKELFYGLPINRFSMLSAPPGCGKTHSLVKKLETHLSAVDGVYQAKKVLVLSFTRNAVAELKSRIFDLSKTSKQQNLDLIKVMTFDAFAYRVLSDSLETRPSKDFDRNIIKVTSLLKKGINGKSPLLDDIEWIYIDEYQDLVGCRADLVLELSKLIKLRRGAVTLLGDPCQQIMNFQLDNGLSKTTNKQFTDKFEEIAGQELARIEFNESYRFRTEEQKQRVNKLRKQMLTSTEVFKGKYLAQESSITTLQAGSALLCSRNIDCLLARRILIKQGKKVNINNGSDRVLAPSWIFDCFNNWKQTSMSINTFLGRCNQLIKVDGMNEFEYLERLGVVEGDNIKVDKLVRMIEEKGGLSPEFDSQAITISTVHKAKGLQYPQVVYMPHDDSSSSKSDSTNEFYVAVTRAQDKFMFLENRDWPMLKKRKRNALYKHNGFYFLEGIREIDLNSFFPEANSLTTDDIKLAMSAYSSFNFQSYNGKLFVTSTLPSGKTVKLYRLPRLEYYFEFRQPGYISNAVVPECLATFVYNGDNPILENLLGPTCFIKVPVFEGFWN